MNKIFISNIHLKMGVGIQDLEDFIVITNCIAITDTYWMREFGSSLTWKNVSPYRNPLNKVISEYAMTGLSPSGIRIAGSPDFSTDGTFPKCWRKYDNKLELCKAGTEGYSNAGLELYSEVFAYQLSRYLGFSSITYKIGKYKSKLVSICPNMCSEQVGLVSFREWTGVDKTDFEWLLNYAFNNYKDWYKHIIDMLLLDTLICNVDRHFGNIGILVDNETQKFKRFSDIFDNNLSCIPYYVKSDNLKFYLDDIRAKDGRTFNELYRLIKSDYTNYLCRKVLNFKFESLGDIKSKERASILNEMLRYRIKENLSV